MIPKVRAGRPERPIKKDSPFAEFARGLRDLRLSAGLSVRDLAKITGFSASSISTAASGRTLPGLHLTMAFAQACGDDPETWAEHWRALSAQQAPPGEADTFALLPSSAEEGRTMPAEAWAPDNDDTGEDRRSRQRISGYVRTASGHQVHLAEGDQVVFGRGPGADLVIAAGRGLSRRAGIVSLVPAGAWIANISRTHALYVAGDEYRIRLPRLGDDSEPSYGWFLRLGTASVGSRSMLDDESSLEVSVIRASAMDAMPTTRKPGAAQAHAEPGPATDNTLLPFYLDPMTKLFLVALIWCRPWLLDPAGTRPLPRVPEIAREALQITGAFHELERFDSSPEFRDALSARVAEHIKVLRRKLADHGLAGADARLSEETAVRILIEHGIITSADLSRLEDPVWRSRQEDLWWTRG